jgi:hypothetical protein
VDRKAVKTSKALENAVPAINKQKGALSMGDGTQFSLWFGGTPCRRD